MGDMTQHRRSVAALDRPATTITRAATSPLAVRLAANAKGSVTVTGLASRTGAEYQMWDAFGPYTEIVAAGAFDETLAAEPTVLFTINHGGLALASTDNGSLRLAATDDGLTYEADLPLVDPDVFALTAKVERGVVTESSMMFRITGAQWNETLDVRTITGIDLHRGDVSAVLYGANPHTEITVDQQRAAPVDQRQFERAHLMGAPDDAEARAEQPPADDESAVDALARRSRLLDAQIRLADHHVR